MKKILLITILIITASCSSFKFIGQPISFNVNEFNKPESIDENIKENWSLLDINSDMIPGMSILKANNELIKNQKGKSVIVAIIDSGVEIGHPYLSPYIWNNSDEIPNNKIDDDKNGYVDDINGWNFLGDSNKENLEYVRLFKKTSLEDPMSKVYKKEIDEAINKNNETISRVKYLYGMLFKSDSLISSTLGKDKFTIVEAKDIPIKTIKIEEAIRFLEFAKSNSWSLQSLSEASEYYQSSNNFHNNINFNGREVVGDDPDDFSDSNYGNSDVLDRNKHGTHVGGIVRSISKSAIIMPIRCVPDGDEYDKDVALSIRYAVDNGATIINFSFGKKYSPHSDWVIDAMKYAEERDVLIVNAAGNDSNNIDLIENESYPTDQKDGNEFLNNLITVGASSYSFDSGQVAYFSNFGSKNVDLFAPGFQIYSSVLDGKFEYLNGTSMAAPNVTGVAVVLRSFYPKLSASSIKHILMSSGVDMNKTLKKPKSDDILDPNSFSRSGKTVNLYNALLFASNYKEKDPLGFLRKFKSKN
tara:strand:+ start:918 stop:2504 length:1587 start_codon:yes stop_codon:yes gene_type:complete